MASFIGLRACLLAGVAVPASAAHASEVKELEAVVARQSAMIEALQARVAALETQKGASASASVPVRQVDQTTAATVITASSGKAEQPPAQQNNLLTSRDAGPVGSVVRRQIIPDILAFELTEALAHLLC